MKIWNSLTGTNSSSGSYSSSGSGSGGNSSSNSNSATMSTTAHTSRRLSTSMLVLAALVVGLGLGLFIINYWHATKCASDRSPDEVEDMVRALKNRLLEAESKVLKNEIMMTKLIYRLQSNLFKLEQKEYNELVEKSSTDAVEVALMLSAHPAPPMPLFPLDSQYTDPEALANAIDDIFKQEGELELYGGEEQLLSSGSGGSGGGGDRQRGDNSNSVFTDQIQPSITDAEASEKCLEWKKQYNVIVGASWGDLPYDLQQKWLEYSCDYHLREEGNGGEEESIPSGESTAAN